MRRTIRTTALASAALALTLGLAACGSDDDTSDAATDGDTTSTSPTPSEPMDEGEDMEEDMGEAPAASEAFGPACDALPAQGPGSLADMAEHPVATAASRTPILSTLVAAVAGAELVETLDTADGLTLFAPTNEAFEAVGEKALADLLADKQALTQVLTHHVVAGQLGPDEVGGTHETLNGDTIEVSGQGTEWTVGDEDARVVCGNVATANATVYVIDTVLLP